MHLAQLNIAKALAPLDSEQLKDFTNNLERVNAIAEQSPGFIWRLKDESGDATNIQAFDDPMMIVNMSVWSDIDSLKHFMFNTMHAQFMRRRKEWFERLDKINHVLWWIEEGHIPSLNEAKSRLEHLHQHSDSAYAFSFKNVFEPETPGQ